MSSKEEALACARAYVREPFLRREKEADELVKSIYVTAHQLAMIEAKERANEIDILLRSRSCVKPWA